MTQKLKTKNSAILKLIFSKTWLINNFNYSLKRNITFHDLSPIFWCYTKEFIKSQSTFYSLFFYVIFVSSLWATFFIQTHDRRVTEAYDDWQLTCDIDCLLLKFGVAFNISWRLYIYSSFIVLSRGSLNESPYVRWTHLLYKF